MSNQQSIRFKSKVDTWLAAVIVIALLIPTHLVFASQGVTRGNQLSLPEVVLIIGLPYVLIIWFYSTTVYELTATELIVRAGPIRKVIPLDKLQRIRASNSVMSAPALSLDRLDEFR
jgi:hypothetical protein